ncbi:mechanosensitive ion channel family protein [Desertihabitans aurantiacus]|uniref:mechanosensitive ion channel family protein n=1 Tax=Desertihabitans aurantiacus TaxID=2282477 RepID=UPI0018E55F69|nr:mechanosensitive ion channel family protein [Desertihabitans aurantiacus]
MPPIPQALNLVWPDTAITIAVILLAAVVVRLLLARAITRIVAAAVSRSERHTLKSPGGRLLKHTTGIGSERYKQRAETLGSLLRSVSTALIVVLTVLTIMSEVGLPLGPLLASAGIGGIALGFGAQSLVKDYFAGIFMIIEDQYGVGDFIDTGEATGTVEEVTLRVTRLRDATGVVWYVRNGEIVRIGNQSQGWSTAIVDIPVASTEDPARVIELLRGAVADVAREEQFAEDIIEDPAVVGVDSIVGNTMTIRILGKTKTNAQWALQREILERCQTTLAAAGVKGPPVVPGAPLPAV